MESSIACEWKIISGFFYKRGSSMLKDFVLILPAISINENQYNP